MEREDVKAVVRTTLAVVSRVARRTRTQADDLMAGVLQANEERLAEVVAKLLEAPDQPPSDQQIVQALASVGIKL